MSTAEQQPSPPHLRHEAPLLWLARHIHRTRTLRENVVRLRWRRKRSAAAVDVDAAAAFAAAPEVAP